MTQPLTVSIGQHSEKGHKEANHDFHGALIPTGSALALKGIAVAIADGISTSSVSHIAAESAVKSFLTDYYCTSDAWSVKTAARRVISATNSWLHAETRRSQCSVDMDRGYVCTFTAMILKSCLAHVFHIGDCRVSRLAGCVLEPLTNDHRVIVSSQQSYLSRALGAKPSVEIDYTTVPLQVGDTFILSSDGVHEHVSGAAVVAAIKAHADDLDRAACTIVDEALRAGSRDNLTVQIVRIEAVPDGNAGEFITGVAELGPSAPPEPGNLLDGYRIVRELHSSSRSHVYLAFDTQTQKPVALKLPSTELRNDADHLKRFIMEEWIARRMNSPHVLKAQAQSRKRSRLYVVTEYVEGRTLAQWMIDHPHPDLDTVRDIAEQIVKGLHAFHRLEMLHQDLRPQNVMIDQSGTVKIIDFGSARVAGVVEAAPEAIHDDVLGTAQYAAPEYFAGERGTWRSDLFSLGVIVYQMLTSRLPYGAEVSKIRSPMQQRRLRYVPASEINPEVPEWMDHALRKALHPNPMKRYDALSEFTFDLRHPNPTLLKPAPLAQRNPVTFWKCVSGALSLAVILLLWHLTIIA
ncbi:bifunctional protein-serine/threonine kinase/phosphatase [Microvirga arsenatis]|uniref:Protein kinase n=1 Tax=Microvirga arsenatis TaxID=2692265 RepID=A0ABW9Z2F2_9HYPH|nr:bifunctional protein-serine/threonine kinase/phosphatase [Microvirga arsenatis]NBJ12841.1 protein kinase [Microvirga arsenatis]NBJ26700.1 protein kinase [Microvirga arsenatis]